MANNIPYTSRKLKAKQVILYQGEVPRDVYVVTKGYVRSYVIAHNGDEKNVAVFGEGSFMPVGWAIGASPVAINYYETVTDTEVKVYTKQDFNQLMKDPDFAVKNTHNLARQLLGANLQITALAQIHAQDKILRTLYFLATCYGGQQQKDKAKITIQLTQEDIARYAGLTRETTATEINKLKRDKTISVKSKIYTLDVPKILKKLGENDYSSLSL